jgi:sec-independent protein translocase protein TatA
MGSMSILHWLVVLIVVVILFGRNGRIARTMGDIGQGIREFKAGLNGQQPPVTGGDTAKLPDADSPKTSTNQETDKNNA